MDDYTDSDARAVAYRLEALVIQRKREAAARALLAPPGPAAAVKADWQALIGARTDRRQAPGIAGARNGD